MSTAENSRPFARGDYRRVAELLGERKTRQCEALKLYRPLPEQEKVHRSQAYVRLLIGGNRGGKTVAAAVEFARMVTGQDPYEKYPKTDGKVYVVGKSLKHIGDTLYPKIFKAGALKMIRDADTGEWRAFRPWDPADQMRSELRKPMPPLIPERFVKHRAWHHKGKNEISRIVFSTGWEALFFSADGSMPQGSNVNVVWFDEEIGDSPDGEWFPEMTARLVDDGGVLVWSATPQSGFEQLYDLHTKGELQLEQYKLDPKKNPKPEIVSFQFDLADNPHLGREEKERFLRYLNEEQSRVRGSGDFTVSGLRIYPEFQVTIHSWPLKGKIPKTWTRYAYVDPGHTICAVLFIACPSIDECPDREPIVIAYDELYIPQCNAPLFGQRMKEKAGDDFFEAFYIDVHGAPREAGSGLSIREQYSTALEKNKVKSRLTGHEFAPADDNRRAGVLKVHEYLLIRSKGGPKFRIAVEDSDPTIARCPNLVFNMKKYRKKRVKGVVIDDPEDRGPTHLCQCVRYMAMSEPEYVTPTLYHKSWQEEMFEHVQMLSRQRNATPGTIHLGPAA
jgi:hypothetical protein